MEGLVDLLVLPGAGQPHQCEGMPVDLILLVECAVEFHHLEDRCHGLIAQPLLTGHDSDFLLELVEAHKYLLHVFQIAVMLSSQSLELLAQLPLSFPG